MKKLPKEITENIVYTESSLQYMGGFADMEGGKKADLIIYKDKISLIFARSVKTILIDDLIITEIKSEIQLQNDINLAKILTWGIFALGSTKEVVKNYILISYNDKIDGERYIVLKSSNNEKIVKLIRETKSNRVNM
jgi:hypothetical protein